MAGDIFAETNAYSKCQSGSPIFPISFSATSFAYSRRNCQKYMVLGTGKESAVGNLLVVKIAKISGAL